MVALVWGDEYIQSFLQLVLPSLLSPGNLPALSGVAPCVFCFYTRAADVRRLDADAAVRALRVLADVKFHLIDQYLDRTPDNYTPDFKYALMNACHKAAVREAGATGAAVVFIGPDAVQADGSLAKVARVVRAGKRAVMFPGVRVVKETAGQYLYDRYAREPGTPITILPRDLVRVALDHMHPLSENLFVDSDDFSPNPTSVCWSGDENGFILRSFHPYPVLIFPEHPDVDFVSTLDDDLVLLACPNYETFCVVEDSDEAFYVDLTDSCRTERQHEANRASVPELRRRSREFANLHHRRFFMHAMRVHAAQPSKALFQAERRSARVARRLWVGWQLERLTARLLRTVSSLTDKSLLERSITNGLSWELLPLPGRLWRAVLGMLLWLGANRLARRIERARRIGLATQATWIFGERVASRALRLRPKLRERIRHRVKENKLARGLQRRQQLRQLWTRLVEARRNATARCSRTSYLILHQSTYWAKKQAWVGWNRLRKRSLVVAHLATRRSAKTARRVRKETRLWRKRRTRDLRLVARRATGRSRRETRRLLRRSRRYVRRYIKKITRHGRVLTRRAARWTVVCLARARRNDRDRAKRPDCARANGDRSSDRTSEV